VDRLTRAPRQGNGSKFDLATQTGSDRGVHCRIRVRARSALY